MSIIITDDRTEEEKSTYPFIVIGTDRFLSGWGLAKGGLSYAGWACQDKDLGRVERWVRNRSDMRRVRVVGKDYRPSNPCVHLHIYVAREGHPSLD
jgi:hypothetical protein